MDSKEFLSEVIIYSKYAKHNKTLGRRENWVELIQRNADMHADKYPEIAGEIYSVYARSVLTKKVVPSMRSFQFAGRAIEVNHSRMFNCFDVNERFVTADGTMSFSNYSDGESVVVPTHTGAYKDATVKCFGKQKLNLVTFKRGVSKKVVRVTPDHRWILGNGESTTSLDVGDKLVGTPNLADFDYDNATPELRTMWAYGFVFGDGTLVADKNGDKKHSMVRLCGAKNQYASRFEELGFSSSKPKSCGGDNMFYTGTYLKSPIDLEVESVDSIKAFVNGLLCADGYMNSNYTGVNSRFKSIQVSGEHVDFVGSALEVAGYYITGEDNYTGKSTNYKSKRGYTKRFRLSSNPGNGHTNNFKWEVESIVPDGSDDVWCLVVEDDASFILSGGMVTGNCASRKLDSATAFAEVMFLLLGGSGVGISVQKQHISEIPGIKGPNNTHRKFVVSDDIMGWADAIKALMKSYLNGTSAIDFDYSDIRPKGTRLVTAGGKAPGPEPLKECVAHIRRVLDRAIEDRGVGAKMKSIEAHDIACYIANSVLAGGIRRSAMISLFSHDDNEMLLSKGNFSVDVKEVEKLPNDMFSVVIDYNGRDESLVISQWDLDNMRDTGTIPWYYLEEQRGRANNSVMLLRSETGEDQFRYLMKKVEDSKAGEPGVYWTNDLELGTNPCCEISLDLRGGFCVDGDTKLITREGVGKISDLIETDVDIWNGEKWSAVTPVKTGTDQDMYRVEFSDGSYLDATSYHKFLVKNRFQKDYKEVQTIDLMDLLADSAYGLSVPRANIVYNAGGDSVSTAYDYGFILGDGSIDYNENGGIKDIRAGLFGEKLTLPLSGKLNPTIEVNKNGVEFQRMSFGSVVDRKFAGKLKHEDGLPPEIFGWDRSSILNFIAGWADADGSNASNGIRVYGGESNIRDAQLLLTKCGIDSSVNLMGRTGDTTNLSVRKNDVWYVQITKTIDIPCVRLTCDNGVGAKFKGKSQIVKSVTKLDGKFDSFCFEELELHQGVFNNVLTKQCNLTEANVSELESEADFIQRIKDATFLGTLQAGYTEFHYLGEQWREIAEDDALLGVSMTGIGSGQVLEYDITKAAEAAKGENARVAGLIGLNPAKRIGTVKPSGTASLVLGCSSGIHAWHNDHYIRRVRVNKDEALYQYALDKLGSNFVEDDAIAPHSTGVLSIPIKAPAGSILRTESPIDLMERVKRVQLDWIRATHIEGKNAHNVSVTVSVQPDQWGEVTQWMWDNREIYNGISLLDYDGGTYPQMPFEDCSKDHYELLVESLIEKSANFNIDDIKEEEDNTDHSGEAACSGGACEVSAL